MIGRSDARCTRADAAPPGAAGGLRGVRALLAALAFVTCAPASAQDDLPPDLRPYRVSLSLGFADVPEFPVGFRDQVRRDVRRLLDRTIGERWSVTLLDDANLPRRTDMLSTLTPADVPIERKAPVGEATLGFPAKSAPDKFLFATVTTDGPGFVTTAREWDRLTDSVGPVTSATAATRDGIPQAVITAIRSAFRPVAEVGTGDESAVALTVRAAGIPTPDPDAGTIEPGTLFVPHLRRFDRDGNLEEVRTIPYTLLGVTRAEGGTATAAVHSALRSALGSRRGRVEAWAIAAPPTVEATRLVLVRDEDGVPLSGRVVEVRPTPFLPGQEQPPAEATLLTDRSGSVMLPADPERPLVWLTVRSGDAVLMRFPLAPGVEPTVTLSLGDDQRRLDAEGRLAILTGELIETVAKRATLLAKARSGARAGRYEEAEAAVAEAETLPDAASFRRRLAAVATPAAKAAEEAGDRIAAARIRALGRKASELVDRYLNPDPLRATREEVEELKRTDPDR